MDRGAWRATAHEVAKSWTRLSNQHSPSLLKVKCGLRSVLWPIPRACEWWLFYEKLLELWRMSAHRRLYLPNCCKCLHYPVDNFCSGYFLPSGWRTLQAAFILFRLEQKHVSNRASSLHLSLSFRLIWVLRHWQRRLPVIFFTFFEERKLEKKNVKTLGRLLQHQKSWQGLG